MSVLIRGMKMPDCCWNCPCVDGEYGECNFLGKTIKCGNGRLADCPLVELPDHGDLIDRDALMEEAKILGTVTCHQPFDFPYKCNLVEWCKLAPVVIPAERSEEDENWYTELDDPKIAERSEE